MVTVQLFYSSLLGIRLIGLHVASQERVMGVLQTGWILREVVMMVPAFNDFSIPDQFLSHEYYSLEL